MPSSFSFHDSRSQEAKSTTRRLRKQPHHAGMGMVTSLTEVERVLTSHQTGPELDLSKVAGRLTDVSFLLMVQYAKAHVMPTFTCLRLSQCIHVSCVGMRGFILHFGPAIRQLDMSHTRTWAPEVLKVLSIGFEILDQVNFRDCGSLSTSSLRDFMPCCHESLTTLNIANCPTLSDDAVGWLAGTTGAKGSLSHCRRLRSLDVSLNSQFTNRSLTALARGCPYLRFVNLEGLSQVTDAGVTALASGCRYLQVLSLKKCSKITDVSLTALGQGCPKLQSLNVAVCAQLTAQGIAGLVDSAGPHPRKKKKTKTKKPPLRVLVPQTVVVNTTTSQIKPLQSLNLEGCLQISEIALQLLATFCPDLQFLNVSGCQLMTENGLKTLMAHFPYVRPSDNFRGFEPHAEALGLKLHRQHTTVQHSATLVLQSLFRGYVGRQDVRNRKTQAIFVPMATRLQRWIRGKQFQANVHAATRRRKHVHVQLTKLQALVRGTYVRTSASRTRARDFASGLNQDSATTIQRHVRGRHVRHHNAKFVNQALVQRRHELYADAKVLAAVKLQRAIRRRHSHSRLELLLSLSRQRRKERGVAVVRIQRHYRARVAMKYMWMLRQSKEQRQAEVEAREQACGQIQRTFRGFLWRREWTRFCAERRAEVAKIDRAATSIQAWVRGTFTRMRLEPMMTAHGIRKTAASCIQRSWRHYFYIGALAEHVKFEFNLELIANVKAALAQEEALAMDRKAEHLVAQRQNMYHDSASEEETTVLGIPGTDTTITINTNGEDDWQVYFDDVTNVQFWFSPSRGQKSFERPNDFGFEKSLIGTRVRVYWPLEVEWYVGTIVSFHCAKGKHRIDYEDGDHEWFVLKEEADRVQLNLVGDQWMMFCHYAPTKLAIKAALFIQCHVRVYAHEYLGWREGRVMTYLDDVAQSGEYPFGHFSIAYNDSDEHEYVPLLFPEYQDLAQVYDIQTQDWLSLAEFYFGKNVSPPGTLGRGEDERYERPRTVEAFLEHEQVYIDIREDENEFSEESGNASFPVIVDNWQEEQAGQEEQDRMTETKPVEALE